MIHSFQRDLHVLKYFSSVITVSEGKVLHVTEPSRRYCPLASHFFETFKKMSPTDLPSLRGAIRQAIESKIQNYGFFTPRRTLHFPKHVVPYGASEMLAAAVKNRFLETAVVVCDGAGTVVARSPETIQGIGARMNTLIFTSPIQEVIKKLKAAGCHIISEDNAWIDQVQGVEMALALGFKKIGVTVAASDAEQLGRIRELEKKEAATVVILAVCTSGVSDHKLNMIGRHADLAWACASGEARNLFGKKARLQISRQIPVYALTHRGVETAFSFLGASSKDLVDPASQYLVSREAQGISLGAGSPGYYLRATALPVGSSKAPY